MKNVKQDENSSIETIDERLKRLRTNKIDGRNTLEPREEKGWEGGKNKGNLEGGTNEYLEEKTPVEIIEERKQRLRTSRMDTRLRTPVPRRRRVGGWEKKTTAGRETPSLRADCGLNLAKMKRLEST